MKHSEGKWNVEKGEDTGLVWIEDEKGDTICDFYHKLWTGENGDAFHKFDNAEANAQRIVACVNACEHIKTEWLEKNTFTSWPAQKERLEKENHNALNLLEIAIEERDKERAVKKELLKALKMFSDISYRLEGCSNESCTVCAENNKVIELIEQAIQSAEKRGYQ